MFRIWGFGLGFLLEGSSLHQGDFREPLNPKSCTTPEVDRIWGIWGSCYNTPEATFFLLKGDYNHCNAKWIENLRCRVGRSSHFTWGLVQGLGFRIVLVMVIVVSPVQP